MAITTSRAATISMITNKRLGVLGISHEGNFGFLLVLRLVLAFAAATRASLVGFRLCLIL